MLSLAQVHEQRRHPRHFPIPSHRVSTDDRPHVQRGSVHLLCHTGQPASSADCGLYLRDHSVLDDWMVSFRVLSSMEDSLHAFWDQGVPRISSTHWSCLVATLHLAAPRIDDADFLQVCLSGPLAILPLRLIPGGDQHCFLLPSAILHFQGPRHGAICGHRPAICVDPRLGLLRHLQSDAALAGMAALHFTFLLGESLIHIIETTVILVCHQSRLNCGFVFESGCG